MENELIYEKYKNDILTVNCFKQDILIDNLTNNYNNVSNNKLEQLSINISQDLNKSINIVNQSLISEVFKFAARKTSK